MAKSKRSFGTKITNWLIFLALNLLMILALLAIIGGLLGKIWRTFSLPTCPHVTIMQLSWGTIIVWVLVLALSRHFAQEIK